LKKIGLERQREIRIRKEVCEVRWEVERLTRYIREENI
jgi:hypothetical protein